MSRRGRAAALPGRGTSTIHGLLAGGTVVRRYPEPDRWLRDFDFSVLPASEALQRVLAAAFARRTAPGHGLTSLSSIQNHYSALRLFTEYLTTLSSRPADVADLVAEHIDGFLASRRVVSSARLNTEMLCIKTVLLQVDSLDPYFVAKLREPTPPNIRAGPATQSYSRAEFRRIAAAARADLRAAAKRIRDNRILLARYRAGQLADPTRRLELLDFVDRHADAPRSARRDSRSGTSMIEKWVSTGGFGRSWEIVGWAHLTGVEVTAGAVLLAILTGQNPAVIFSCPAAHHRADGRSQAPGTAILDTHKPRRGRRAYMNLVLTGIPDWISIPQDSQQRSSRDELHTPFGLYQLLLELTARSRALIDSDLLLIGYQKSGGRHHSTGRGLRGQPRYGWLPQWSERHSLPADRVGDGPPSTLTVTLERIRLTYLELHQKPVAHTEQTLVNDYLGRNRGNIVEYRRVVADALAEEVAKARARGMMPRLTAADVARAGTCGDAVAAEQGLEPVTSETPRRRRSWTR